MCGEALLLCPPLILANPQILVSRGLVPPALLPPSPRRACAAREQGRASPPTSWSRRGSARRHGAWCRRRGRTWGPKSCWECIRDEGGAPSARAPHLRRRRRGGTVPTGRAGRGPPRRRGARGGRPQTGRTTPTPPLGGVGRLRGRPPAPLRLLPGSTMPFWRVVRRGVATAGERVPGGKITSDTQVCFAFLPPIFICHRSAAIPRQTLERQTRRIAPFIAPGVLCYCHQPSDQPSLSHPTAVSRAVAAAGSHLPLVPRPLSSRILPPSLRKSLCAPPSPGCRSPWPASSSPRACCASPRPCSTLWPARPSSAWGLSRVLMER